MKLLRLRKQKNEANRLVKEYIVTALIELMKEQDYNSITITDITRKAGVSRMAYYRNYNSKDDILNNYMEEIAATVHETIETAGSKQDIYEYFLTLFEQLGAYRDVGLTVYRAHLGELILRNITQNISITFPPFDNAPGDKYRHAFLAGAFYNVFIEWLKGGLHEGPGTMAKICADMATNGCPTPFDEVNRGA